MTYSVAANLLITHSAGFGGWTHSGAGAGVEVTKVRFDFQNIFVVVQLYTTCGLGYIK